MGGGWLGGGGFTLWKTGEFGGLAFWELTPKDLAWQASHFLTLWPPHLEQSPPRHQALCCILSLPSKANSKHFSKLKINNC